MSGAARGPAASMATHCSHHGYPLQPGAAHARLQPTCPLRPCCCCTHRSAEATLRQYISTEHAGAQGGRVAAARQVYAESAGEVAQALALVAQLDALYPGTSRALKTQLVAQVGAAAWCCGAGAEAVVGTAAWCCHGASWPAVLLLHCCCTAAALLLHCCCTAAALLLHCCCTAAAAAAAALLLAHLAQQARSTCHWPYGPQAPPCHRVAAVMPAAWHHHPGCVHMCPPPPPTTATTTTSVPTTNTTTLHTSATPNPNPPPCRPFCAARPSWRRR